jgi:hypothetical protein
VAQDERRSTRVRRSVKIPDQEVAAAAGKLDVFTAQRIGTIPDVAFRAHCSY